MLLCCSYNTQKNYIANHLDILGKKFDIQMSKYDHFLVVEIFRNRNG